MSSGTTLIAIKCPKTSSIYLGSDTRAWTGNHYQDGYEKCKEICPSIFILGCGTSIAFETVYREIKSAQPDGQSQQEQIFVKSIAESARKSYSTWKSNNRYSHLNASFIVAGHDSTGNYIYTVNEDKKRVALKEMPDFVADWVPLREVPDFVFLGSGFGHAEKSFSDAMRQNKDLDFDVIKNCIIDASKKDCHTSLSGIYVMINNQGTVTEIEICSSTVDIDDRLAAVRISDNDDLERYEENDEVEGHKEGNDGDFYVSEELSTIHH